MANAMILAAGFGTRMRPLTLVRPKCLMPVMNRPFLDIWLERLAAWGFERAVVNTHHLAPMVQDYLAQAGPYSLRVMESHEPEILGTGGGLAAAREALGPEPFLSISADVLFSADVRALMERQAASGALAVLGLVDDARFNTVALAGERVLGFRGDAGMADAPQWLNYANAGVFAPELLDYLPDSGFSNLVDGLRAAIRDGRLVLGMAMPGWWDNYGNPGQLWELHRDLIKAPMPGLESLRPHSPLVLADGAKVSAQAQISGFAVLGEGAVIEGGAQLRDSVLLPGARVLSGVRVQNAVLGDGFVADKDIDGGAHA